MIFRQRPERQYRAFPRDGELGSSKQPRSYGRVLRAIRESLELTQWEMFDRVVNEDCPFPLPSSVQSVKDEWCREPVAGKDWGLEYDCQSAELWEENSRKRRTNVVSDWERGNQYIDFAIQIRYGSITSTRNGIPHVVSAFYADFREVCDQNNTITSDDPSIKSQQWYLGKIEKNLAGLKAFTNHFEALVTDLRKGDDGELRRYLANNATIPLDAKFTKYHLYFIQDLIHAYASGSSHLLTAPVEEILE